jgi:hypothetical protein
MVHVQIKGTMPQAAGYQVGVHFSAYLFQGVLFGDDRF